MPFKKVGSDDYTSPSGRHFNGAQVRLWHANGNKFPGQKQSESYSGGGVVAKGYMGKTESFAEGGPVLGRSTDFMKTPDRFRDNTGRVDNFEKGAVSKKADAAPPKKTGKGLPLPKK